jgi:histidine triad (HIT) family protein
LGSPPDDCLFCRLAQEGPHVATTEGFVAIRDINPAAPVHLLIIPVRHLDSFRDVALLDAEESKRMLDFLAETARQQGLRDYRVVANVGAGAGQTVFHLHWHLLGDPDAGSLLEAETP